MAAVITMQPSSAAGPGASPSSFQHSHRPLGADHALRRHHSHQSVSINTTPSESSSVLSISRGPGRDGRSCDACLRRKSRCAMNELVNKCYSCDFHRQDCTFTLSTFAIAPPSSALEAQSRKRKLEWTVPEPESVTRTVRVASPLALEAPKPQRRDIAPDFWAQSALHIGATTALEPALLEHLPLDQNDEAVLATTRVRKYGSDGTFVRLPSTLPSADSSSTPLDVIETLVAPYGATLIEKYFEHIHPVFPVLVEDAFRQSYRTKSNLSPLLLSAVYVLACKFVEGKSSSQILRPPDVGRLESTAMKLLNESLPRPSISTIQAGILLMQKSSLNTAALNAQLVAVAFELGLHQDCSSWKMEIWEQGLRKRLAWALYMQDKWAALVHGRPSHITSSNWRVKDLVEQDFLEASQPDPQEDDSPVRHGPLLFCHMVALTTILSDILDRFYTLQATDEFQSAGEERTRMILEKAKPAQLRLKEWFAALPAQLKMDSSSDLLATKTEDTASNGALHLAYFATEITLHRCIVRSLTDDSADSYLAHICRSAAKTRLISAMDFVNRLRPSHLRAFWPAAARTNFALIGSFGVLLRITAPTKEEAEFYRLRLCEFRWTLSVSRKDAEFLNSALESLDIATSLDQHVPEKPAIDELMTNAAAKPAVSRRPARPHSNVHFDDESLLNDDSALDTGRGGSPSVRSGLASPASSMSDEELPADEPDTQ